MITSTLVESGSNNQSPLTSADLLIALHNIDPAVCDMKIIIKGNIISLKIFFNCFFLF